MLRRARRGANNLSRVEFMVIGGRLLKKKGSTLRGVGSRGEHRNGELEESSEKESFLAWEAKKGEIGSGLQGS